MRTAAAPSPIRAKMTLFFPYLERGEVTDPEAHLECFSTHPPIGFGRPREQRSMLLGWNQQGQL